MEQLQTHAVQRVRVADMSRWETRTGVLSYKDWRDKQEEEGWDYTGQSCPLNLAPPKKRALKTAKTTKERYPPPLRSTSDLFF